MIAASDLAAAVMGGKRELTEDERYAVEDVLDAARDWQNGTLPLGAFAGIATLPAWRSDGKGRYDSTGYVRFLALLTAAPDDPRRSALLRAIDALVAQQDGQRTTRGFFTRDELAATNAPIVRPR